MSRQETLIAVRSKLVYAVDRLKDKFPAALKVEDVINYAFSAAEREDAKTIKLFRHAMTNSPEVAYSDIDKTYRYKPPYSVRSADELIKFFQSETHSKSISVDQLRKGWADCDSAIDQLEKEHKLMVQRAKKDNAPKSIWPDDPSLFANADQEFVDLFVATELPAKDDVIRYLEKSGRTPAGQVASHNGVVAPKAKTRKSRQIVKRSNVHMNGLFKDYSEQRPKGR